VGKVIVKSFTRLTSRPDPKNAFAKYVRIFDAPLVRLWRIYTDTGVNFAKKVW